MKDKASLARKFKLLHDKAEKRAKSSPGCVDTSSSGPETKRLVHELQVQRVELEIQNEELNEARGELEAALGRYMDFYDFAPVGFLSLDRRGVLLGLNLKGAALLGAPRSRLIGQRLESFLARGGRDSFRKVLNAVLESGESASCELTLAGDEPTFVSFQGTSSRFGTECRAVVVDITPQKRHELELELARELLESQVNERTRELADTVEALHAKIAEQHEMDRRLSEKKLMLLQQDRFATLGEMIASIAHQWQQPLNLLGLLSQGLECVQRRGDLNEENLKNTVSKMMSTIDQMSQTVNDFKNFLRPGREQLRYSLVAVVRQTLSLIDLSYREKGIRLEVTAAAEPELFGNPNEYSQVLLNILVNARDALTAREVRNPAVGIVIAEQEGRSVVTVSDNGGGIPAKDIGAIFDRYFSTKAPDAGTGLGLYIAKTIVEQSMRGTLSVQNADGGARFTIAVGLASR